MHSNLIVTTVIITFYIDISYQRQFLPPAPNKNDILKKLLESMPNGNMNKTEEKIKRAESKEGRQTARKLKKIKKSLGFGNELNDFLLNDDNIIRLWSLINGKKDKQINKTKTIKPLKHKAKKKITTSSVPYDEDNVIFLLERLKSIEKEKKKTETLLKNIKMKKKAKTSNQIDRATDEVAKSDFLNELTDMIADKIIKKYNENEKTEPVEKIDIVLGSGVEIG